LKQPFKRSTFPSSVFPGFLSFPTVSLRAIISQNHSILGYQPFNGLYTLLLSLVPSTLFLHVHNFFPCSGYTLGIYRLYPLPGHCVTPYILVLILKYGATNMTTKNSTVWVRERTIPTERPPLVGEVIANFCG
jgi:hypothetical protein